MNNLSQLLLVSLRLRASALKTSPCDHGLIKTRPPRGRCDRGTLGIERFIETIGFKRFLAVSRLQFFGLPNMIYQLALLCCL